jgi:hypothetical protein
MCCCVFCVSERVCLVFFFIFDAFSIYLAAPRIDNKRKQHSTVRFTINVCNDTTHAFLYSDMVVTHFLDGLRPLG